MIPGGRMYGVCIGMGYTEEKSWKKMRTQDAVELLKMKKNSKIDKFHSFNMGWETWYEKTTFDTAVLSIYRSKTLQEGNSMLPWQKLGKNMTIHGLQKT